MLKKLSIITIIASLLGCGSSKSGKASMPEGRLIEVEYSEHGTMAFPNKYYRVEADADGSYWLTHVSQEGDTTRVPVGTRLLYDLRNVIERDRLYSLESHYRTKMQVMDGESWRFYARFDDKNSISSGGENAWPKNLSLGGVYGILDSAYNKLMAEPVPVGEVKYFKYENYASSAEPTEYYEVGEKTALSANSKSGAGLAKANKALKVNNPDWWRDTKKEKQFIVCGISADAIARMNRIIKEHRMFAYDGDYPNPPDVLDGYMWNLSIEFTSGEKVYSHGSNNGPDDNGILLLKKLFDSVAFPANDDSNK